MYVRMYVCTYVCGLAWYNYDEAFRRDAAARHVVNWSGMHVELYNFHISASTWWGFRVGWEPDRVSLHSRTSNMRSASDHLTILDAYLSSELAARRLACPFTSPLVPLLHVSPFRVIPKNHQAGKWRLILGLPRSVPWSFVFVRHWCASVAVHG